MGPSISIILPFGANPLRWEHSSFSEASQNSTAILSSVDQKVPLTIFNQPYPQHQQMAMLVLLTRLYSHIFQSIRSNLVM